MIKRPMLDNYMSTVRLNKLDQYDICKSTGRGIGRPYNLYFIDSKTRKSRVTYGQRDAKKLCKSFSYKNIQVSISAEKYSIDFYLHTFLLSADRC
jgi:hypothetical protein